MRLNQNSNVLMIALWFADKKPNPSIFSVVVSFCNILSSHGITLSSGKHIFLTSTKFVHDALFAIENSIKENMVMILVFHQGKFHYATGGTSIIYPYVMHPLRTLIMYKMMLIVHWQIVKVIVLRYICFEWHGPYWCDQWYMHCVLHGFVKCFKEAWLKHTGSPYHISRKSKHC